jgi:hypothetical protein
MPPLSTPAARPQLEPLEERALPNNLFGNGVADDDGDALFRSVSAQVAAAAAASHAADGNQGNPGVLPPQSHPFGQTYGQWEAAFWQWTYSLPADHHPLTDTAPPSTGQTGHVWFIGGTFAPTVGPGGEFVGVETRDATIPAGTALFFPILNAESSTLEGNGTTQAELSASSKFLIDFVDTSSLFVKIDGQSLQNLTSYRSQSPLFTFGPLPDNNLLGAPAGATSPSVSDGYHIMLAPLSVGQHTLEFGGKLVANPLNLTFVQDITYHITVQPGR